MRPLQALLRSRSLAGSAPDENRPAADAGRRPLVAAGAVVLVVLLLVSAVTPGAAQAKGILGTGISNPNPISLIGSGVSSLLGGLGGDIAKLAVGAFEAIIKALFAPIAKLITTQLIGWVITVPDLTQSNVSRLEQTVEAMGGGLLGAVVTISIIRYVAQAGALDLHAHLSGPSSGIGTCSTVSGLLKSCTTAAQC